jgi:hypothetical protein
MIYLTTEEEIGYCEASIEVCQKKIEVEGPIGCKPWIKIKESFENSLKELKLKQNETNNQ